eukprot:5604167-Heterocapsa_arctica.AAC.1
MKSVTRKIDIFTLTTDDVNIIEVWRSPNEAEKMGAKDAICQFVYLNFSHFDTFTYYTTEECGVDFAKFMCDGLTKDELFLNER